MRRFSSFVFAVLMLVPGVSFASSPCDDPALAGNMYTISRLRHNVRPTNRCMNTQARMYRETFGRNMMNFTMGMRRHTQWQKQFEPVAKPKQETTSSRKIYRWVPGMMQQ